MKKLFPFLLFALCACSKSSDSNKESEFYVRGNCEMCKERIEASVKSVPGVSSAIWDVNTSSLKVAYDSTKVTELALHKSVAATGHGTKQVEMDSNAHNDLPECCQVGQSH